MEEELSSESVQDQDLQALEHLLETILDMSRDLEIELPEIP
jgi:hypothetical protein